MNAMSIIIPVVIVVAVGGLVGYLYLQKKKKAAASPGYSQMPPVSDSWSFVYSNGVSGDASAFSFPKTDGVHYVIKRAAGIAMGKTITMRFNISGAGELKVADPADIPPATVRLFLWGQTINDRWWMHVGANIIDGDQTITAAINQANWGGVGGNPPVQQASFDSVVANPYAMGFSLGGQYFAGHGVYCPEGTKTFKLLEYSVA